MKTFFQLLVNALIVSAKNNYIWFALTFWIYLETKSVVATGLVGGTYMIVSALSNFWFGSLVDHHKKKTVMHYSGVATFILFTLGYLVFSTTPNEVFTSITSPQLWLLVLLLLGGVIAGNIYYIAIPTLVTLLVPEKDRDKANGMFGTVTGLAFSITSVASGLVLAFGGMSTVLLIAIALTVVSIIHLLLIKIPEHSIVHTHEGQDGTDDHVDNKLTGLTDIKQTIKTIAEVPGLFALIFFTTFNNFLGGVFMALMDAYGLSLVSVEVWGLLWGLLSFGFILGGLFIAKFGLGKNPISTLFTANVIMWITSIFFTIQPSIILLSIGILIWIALMPFVEAIEQTIIQKVVPVKRQGRVFGFAHSIEQAATPFTAFLIGPITQYLVIPFMSGNGLGAQLIGSWYGTGQARGIALVFSIAGVIGLLVTVLARHSKYFNILSKRYLAK